MKQLIRKEISLALHPTAGIFLLLTSLMLVPEYPMLISFFYCTLGIFFICVGGRENRDIDFSLLLPVSRKDIVTARFILVIVLEVLQVAMCVPFIALRWSVIRVPNSVGMDPNIALLGMGFVFFGIFNRLFFTRYYRNTLKIGLSFLLATLATSLFMIVGEAATFVIPFVRDLLDTPDPLFMGEKLLVLGIGMLVYGVLTWRAWAKSVESFTALDF